MSTKEIPNYYAIITAEVRYDNSLSSSEKLFYGEISALSSKTGECWASNSYFAKLYDVSPSTISAWVGKLEKAGYIDVRYEKEGKQITKRIMRVGIRIGGQNIDRGVVNKSNRGGQKTEQGWSENLKENNINSNNIKENNINANTTEAGWDKDFLENKVLDILTDYDIHPEDRRFINALEDYKEVGNFNGISKIMDWDDSQRNNWWRALSRIENLYINK